MSGFRSGFCVLLGRPNVGKSTLLNALVGDKVAIVSPRAQTTRNRIVGVRHGDDHQVVFIDTPGIHKPKHRLGEYMVRAARSTLNEIDVAAVVVDATGRPGSGDQAVIDMCRHADTDVIVIINKCDLAGDNLGRRCEQYGKWGLETYLTSAVTGRGVELVADGIVNKMPEGPAYYPGDMVTDQPERLLAAELVREQVLMLTRDEVPHSIAVGVEEFTHRSDDMVYVAATIFVDKRSHKGIIIGKDGGMLKEIGRRARHSIEALLGSRMYLDLWVKVMPGWRDRERVLREFGYGRGE